MNALTSTFLAAIRSSGAIACSFGPGADVLRSVPFAQGRALKGGTLANFANCRKADLVAECAQRGLTGDGIVSDLVNRLVRSDTDTLVDADLIALEAAGPVTDLDTAAVQVSSASYPHLKR